MIQFQENIQAEGWKDEKTDSGQSLLYRIFQANARGPKLDSINILIGQVITKVKTKIAKKHCMV